MMKWGFRFLIGVGALLLVGGAGTWAVSPQTTPTAEAERSTSSEQRASGILDGMTFLSKLGLSGKPADVEDDLVFSNGTFFSRECDRRCGYPPGPYYVRRIGDKIEFVSESQCVHKDATLSWQGTIENGTIKGRILWTAVRWYWTIEKELWFEGTLVDSVKPVGSSR